MKKISRKIIIIILLAIFTPYLIHLFYYIGENYFAILKTRFSPEEILSYSGSALAFIGTAILGLVTITQTQKANEETEKANNQIIELTKRQVDEAKDVERAIFRIKNVLLPNKARSYQFDSDVGKYTFTIPKESIEYNGTIKIRLSNISNSYALNFNFNSPITLREYQQKHIDIEPKKDTTLTVYFSKILNYLTESKKHEFKIYITYENIYDKKYKQTITVFIEEY